MTVAVPTAIGCFLCGRTCPVALAIYAQCALCGATVGACKLCSFNLPEPVAFLAGSIEWHQQRGRCPGRLDAQVDAIVAWMRGTGGTKKVVTADRVAHAG